MAQKYKFKVGEKPVITVEIPEAAPASVVQRGPLTPYEDPMPPGRRGGEIRLFDLGYLRSGSDFVNLAFTDPNSGGTIQSPGVFPTFDTLTLAMYEQLQTNVFMVPMEEWKDTFKQIDDSYENIDTQAGNGIALHYRGNSYNSLVSPQWTGDSFKVGGDSTDALIAGVTSGVSIGLYANYGPVPTKITAELDFDADEVAFVPSTSMDIFLMPPLITAELTAYHDYTPIPPLGFIGYQELDKLDILRFLYPRELFQDPTAELYGTFLIQTFRWSTLSGPDDLAAYEAAFDVVTKWRDNYGGVRARRSISGTLVPTSQVDIDPATEFAPLALYPTPPSLPGDPKTVELSAQFNAVLLGNMPNGALIGVIKKGDAYYYVWWP